MPYSYIEHVSDIGIHASGATLEEAFEQGAEAMLAVIFDLDTVGERESFPVTASAPAIDLLFVEVLNEILSVQDTSESALKKLEAKAIDEKKDGYVFTGTAFGERFDPQRHGVRCEVKGATYAGLVYEHRNDKAHILECVLDV